jgi:hypothetical protein
MLVDMHNRNAPQTMRTTAFRIAGCREQQPQIFFVSFPLFYANRTGVFHIADFRKIQYYFYKIRRLSGAAQG